MDFTQTAKQAIEAWDRGDILNTIEMGGLGPGYEQCIQVAAIEILREAISAEEKADKALDVTAFEKIAENTIHKLDEDLGGMSGAQFGAARNIAYRAYTQGWGGMLKSAKDQKVEDDRFILISKHFPKVAAKL